MNDMNSYFSHDSNARNSDKLLPVRMKYGAEGYGIYFMLLERLRDEPTYMSIKDYNTLAFDLRVDAQKIKSVIEDFGLFTFTDDGKCFYSEGFMKRMEIKDSKTKARSKAGKKGAEKRWNEQKNSNAIAKPLNKDSKAITMPYQNDGKESKVKETKVNKSKVNHHQEIQEKNDEPVAPSVQNSKLHDDDDFRNLLTYYQQNIGATNPVVVQQLQESVNDFTERKTSLKESYDIVRFAIELTAKNNVHNWNYVNKILLNWQNNSLFTLSNIKANQKERSKQHSSDDENPWDKKYKDQEGKGFWG